MSVVCTEKRTQRIEGFRLAATYAKSQIVGACPKGQVGN